MARLRFDSERIKELRVQRGFSRERLAADLDMSYLTVQRFEQGLSYPRVNTLIEIAHCLKVRPSSFFVEDGR